MFLVDNLKVETSQNTKKIKDKLKVKALGQFYTENNPFHLKQFKSWFKEAKKQTKSDVVLEPFAGSNNLIRMLKKKGYKFQFASFDVEPKDSEVKKRDTIKNFPSDYKIAITNPPWLAKNSARRKGIELGHSWESLDNLYKICLKKMLENCEYVAAILPASFIKTVVKNNSCNKKYSKLLKRIKSYTLLDQKMFNDTENPVCLVLFGGKLENGDFDIFIGEKKKPSCKQIMEEINDRLKVDRQKKVSIKFNSLEGNLGIIAVDKVKERSIRFVESKKILLKNVKISSRHLVRIKVEGKNMNQTVIDELNKKMNEIREIGEILWSPFKGLMISGGYRRRIDFSLVRRIISATV